MDKEQLEARKAELEAELEKGNSALKSLHRQAADTANAMQRVHGALMFIKEIMGDADSN